MASPSPGFQVNDLKSHFGLARHYLFLANKLPETNDPAVVAARAAYAANAQAEMDLVRFYWGWPASQTGYGNLP